MLQYSHHYTTNHRNACAYSNSCPNYYALHNGNTRPNNSTSHLLSDPVPSAYGAQTKSCRDSLQHSRRNLQLPDMLLVANHYACSHRNSCAYRNTCPDDDSLHDGNTGPDNHAFDLRHGHMPRADGYEARSSRHCLRLRSHRRWVQRC